MTEEKQKIRTWKVEAPVGLDIVTANLMNEAELRQFAKQRVKNLNADDTAVWLEKMEKDDIDEVIEYLERSLEYKVEENKS